MTERRAARKAKDLIRNVAVDDSTPPAEFPPEGPARGMGAAKRGGRYGIT